MPWVYEWPHALIRPSAVEVTPVYLSRSGGRLLSGREDIVATDAGYWAMVASFPLRPGGGNRAFRTVRAIKHLLEGRTHVLRMAPWDCSNGPRSLAGVAEPAQIPHDDDTLHADDAGYAQPAIASSVINATAVRATAVNFDVEEAYEIEPGHYFSVFDRLHIVKTINQQGLVYLIDEDGAYIIDEDGAYLVEPGGQSSMTFWPPARLAWPAGTTIEWDNPVGLWRLETDASAGLGFNVGSMKIVVLDLVEATGTITIPPAVAVDDSSGSPAPDPPAPDSPAPDSPAPDSPAPDSPPAGPFMDFSVASNSMYVPVVS